MELIERDIPKTLSRNDYKYVKVLAKGGQGTVCMFEKVDTQEKCAVKFDPSNAYDSSVLIECVYLKKYAKRDEKGLFSCFPKYFDHWMQDGRRYLIM
jgi:hypothetical protein